VTHSVATTLAAAGILDSLLISFGYLAVFGLVGIESLGIPLPGETMLITAGIYAGATHNLSITGVIGAAAAGAIIGDNVGYALGYRGGLPLMRRFGRYLRLDERRITLGRYLFAKYGGRVVFFGRFVSILRTYAAFLAGTSHMRWPRFFAFNAAGGILWSAGYGLAAYYGQDAFKTLSAPLDVALAAAALAAIVWVVRFVRRNADRLTIAAERSRPNADQS
jgi:membrane protein DedA with SNARE-associated domain